MIRTGTCRRCSHEFSFTVKRGRPPTLCTNCPATQRRLIPQTPEEATREKPHRCGRCSSSWNGLTRAHCGSCHSTFSAVANFDKHRINGACRTPEESGLLLRDGLWYTPGYGEEDE